MRWFASHKAISRPASVTGIYFAVPNITAQFFLRSCFIGGKLDGSRSRGFGEHGSKALFQGTNLEFSGLAKSPSRVTDAPPA